jgi:hypothetical protein
LNFWNDSNRSLNMFDRTMLSDKNTLFYCSGWHIIKVLGDIILFNHNPIFFLIGGRLRECSLTYPLATQIFTHLSLDLCELYKKDLNLIIIEGKWCMVYLVGRCYQINHNCIYVYKRKSTSIMYKHQKRLTWIIWNNSTRIQFIPFSE